MKLRKLLVVLSFAAAGCAAAFAGTSSIAITAPAITSLSYSGTSATPATISNLNSQLSTLFGQVQSYLDSTYFSKLHDLGELSEGFANANTAASNNPDIMGYENYKIFSFFVGSSLGFALPALTAAQFNNLGTNIINNGDMYGGLGTGGIAGQLGINTSRFLVRNLYLSLKFGIFNLPNTNLPSNMSGDIHQLLLGLGVNYKLVSPSPDIWGGLVEWRGLSLGTGIEYSRDTLNMNVGLTSQTYSGSFSDPNYPGGTVPVSATIQNAKANLDVVASSFIVPVEVDTSIQFLWVFNLGLGAGADINLPFSTIAINGSGTTWIGLPSQYTYTETPGSVSVNATDSKNTPGFWDYVSPKLSADLGFNISIVKIDIPVAFYPLTKAVSLGIIGGVAW